MKLNKTYFILFVILFIIEFCIAYFLKSGFIRHTVGDFLVVVMFYCFLKSFLTTRPIIIALIVLAISFSNEFLQLTSFLEWLNLQDNTYAKIVLGSTFHFTDLVAYTLGALSVIIVEKTLKK